MALSPQKLGKCSVSSALLSIAFQSKEGARRARQRGHPQLSEDVYSCGSTARLGNFRRRKTRREQIHSYRQAKMNSRNPSNIATLFTHRQPGLLHPGLLHPIHHGKPWRRWRPRSRDRSRTLERRVPIAPDAEPARASAFRLPGLGSGFRLRAQTQAKRPNLLKRFAPSTLEIFQSESVPSGHCSPRGHP